MMMKDCLSYLKYVFNTYTFGQGTVLTFTPETLFFNEFEDKLLNELQELLKDEKDLMNVVIKTSCGDFSVTIIYYSEKAKIKVQYSKDGFDISVRYSKFWKDKLTPVYSGAYLNVIADKLSDLVSDCIYEFTDGID